MDLDIGGVQERVITREEYPLEKAREFLKGMTIAILGYGVQGPGQSMNLRDNGLDVIVGQRTGSESYERALADGWKPGKTLFGLEDAAKRGSLVINLLSDAGQKGTWQSLRGCLSGALGFSHGFSITYQDQTGVVPPSDIDVFLVAPKGTGRSVRENFLAGSGINSSFAVHQNFSMRAEEMAIAYGIAIGSGYLFPTTFRNETVSDLVGERGVLLGALWGIMEAQYEKFRTEGHSPSEAFNETVEELTQSLVPLMGRKGVDFLLANCSATAQRGALDYGPRFKAAVAPLFNELYARVTDGSEARRVLEANSKPGYRAGLGAELAQIRNSEMWRAGEAVRSLRPENQKKS